MTKVAVRVDSEHQLLDVYVGRRTRPDPIPIGMGIFLSVCLSVHAARCR